MFTFSNSQQPSFTGTLPEVTIFSSQALFHFRSTSAEPGYYSFSYTAQSACPAGYDAKGLSRSVSEADAADDAEEGNAMCTPGLFIVFHIIEFSSFFRCLAASRSSHSSCLLQCPLSCSCATATTYWEMPESLPIIFSISASVLACVFALELVWVVFHVQAPVVKASSPGLQESLTQCTSCSVVL